MAGSLDDAAEQPPTTHAAASRVKLKMRMARWYAESAARRPPRPTCQCPTATRTGIRSGSISDARSSARRIVLSSAWR